MFSKEEISGLYRAFILYMRLPKDRWPEIKLAEKFTPEGHKMFEQLTAEVSIEMDKMPDLMKISDAPLAELNKADTSDSGNPLGY